MVEFSIGYASMVIVAVIIALYIAYLRYRFERHLALYTAGEIWGTEAMDRATKIKHLLFPLILYLISLGALVYYYPRLSRATTFWVNFDLNWKVDIPMSIIEFAAFDLIMGAILFSPILISFPGRETVKFISKAYALIFISWLIIESDLIYYNLTVRHLIPSFAELLIAIIILSLPLLYITYKDTKASRS